MSGIIPARWAKLVLIVAGAFALVGGAVNTSHAADDAQIFIVQGLPGRNLDVAVDGKSVAEGLKSAEVGGPYKVNAGSRKVTFSENGDVVLERSFSVTAKSSWDVVIHLPAASATDPAITVFRNDVSPVPRDKANLVVAHMAKVPPADIRVNDKVLFENIANGESLKLTVPVATYEVAIVPTGETKPVILGPGQADGAGWRGQPGLRDRRSGQEDDERRRARHPHRHHRVRPSRPMSTPALAARRGKDSLGVTLTR